MNSHKPTHKRKDTKHLSQIELTLTPKHKRKDTKTQRHKDKAPEPELTRKPKRNDKPPLFTRGDKIIILAPG